MAAVALSEPGSDFGPCLDVNCGHVGCVEDRGLAAQRCTICTEPIGYGRPFYQEDSWRKLTHQVCARQGT